MDVVTAHHAEVYVHPVAPVIVTEVVIRVVIVDVIPVVTAVVPVAARVIVTDNAPHVMVAPTAVVVMEHVQLAVIVAVMQVHMQVYKKEVKIWV